MKTEILPRAEVDKRLSESEWRCVLIKSYTRHSTWRTQHGFYFSVPHECSVADFNDIWADLIRHGRTRSV